MTFDWTSFFNSERWTRLIWILNLIIISCAVYFIVDNAGTIWLEYKIQPETNIALRQTETEQQTANDKLSLQDIQVIYERNLFGGYIKPQAKKKESEPKKEIDVEKIPLAQSLQVKLTGTIVSSDPLENRAIILDKRKRDQSIYREGDQLKEVTIKKILRNKVVVNNGERDEILLMEMDKVASGHIQGQPEQDVPPQDTKTINLSRDFVQESMANMVDLMKKVRIVPYEDKNGNKGFQLTHLKDDSFFRKLGLNNKDVLLGVNGESLESPEKVLQLYTNLQKQDNIKMKVKRGNNVQKINYNIF